MSKYSVRPFSGKNYGISSNKIKGGQSPCAICGRGIDDAAWPHTAIVIDGGDGWGDDASPVDAGHMGEFPVGKDCHKKYAV